MSEKELKRKYNKLVSDIEGMRMFDGRNKGVDVYVCEKCGHKFYTRYKDKGVTPFTIKCRKCQSGSSVHDDTISEQIANFMAFDVQNWVRPSFEQLNKFRKKGNDGVIEHVLNGGLLLETELNTQS